MNPVETTSGTRVRISVNICRCCLTEDCYKDISCEYYYSGGKEIYEEMLDETFHIKISEQDGCARLICDGCIMRLRDAHEFKQMVLQSEERFAGYLESWDQNDVRIELLNDDSNSLEDLNVKQNHKDAEKGSDNVQVSDPKAEPAMKKGPLELNKLLRMALTKHLGELSNTNMKLNTLDNVSDVKEKRRHSDTDGSGVKKKPKFIFEEDTNNFITDLTSEDNNEPAANELLTEDLSIVFSDPQPNNAAKEISQDEGSESGEDVKPSLAEIKMMPLETKTVEIEVKAEIMENNFLTEDFGIEFDEQHRYDEVSFKSETMNAYEDVSLESYTHDGTEASDDEEYFGRERELKKNKSRIKRRSYYNVKKRKSNPTYNTVTTRLRQDSLKLLQNSTILVFQWNQRYKCFCCLQLFTDLSALRHHTNTEHTIKDIERKIIYLQNRIFKVDVSILCCTICGNSLENVDSLRDHLAEVHTIKFDTKEDLLVPFKIRTDFSEDDLQCQMCGQTFNSFNVLCRHSYKHMNKFKCKRCNVGFFNLDLFNCHMETTHSATSCVPCGLIFNTKKAKLDHDKMHTKKRFRYQCPYCPEGYKDDIYRVQHLMEKHEGEKPQYKCNICSELFHTASLLKNHRFIHREIKSERNK